MKNLLRCILAVLFAIGELTLLLHVMRTSALAIIPNQPAAPTSSIHYVAPEADCGSATPCYASIQQAVDSAAAGDEIRVAAGVYTHTYTIDGIVQAVYISKTITIRGGYTTSAWDESDPENNPTIIDPQEQGRGMVISGTWYINLPSPTIEGLSIRNGLIEDDHGGGVFAYYANITLRNCQVFSNTAIGHVYTNTWVGGAGGGLYFIYASLHLERSSVMSNTATTSGGGITIGAAMYIAPINLIENNISGNRVFESTGGALVIASSPGTITNNIISNNVSPLFAAVYICNYSGELILENNTITGNYKDAVYSDYSNLRINNNLIANNGGIGLYFHDLKTGSIVEGNLVKENGQGMIYSGSGRIGENLFVKNDKGGGVQLFYFTGTFEKNLIAFNTTQFDGGGLNVLYSDEAQIDGNIIHGNYSQNNGGGVVFYNSDAILVNNMITDNQANTHGSGVYVRENSSPTLIHNTIARNTGGSGEGIYILSGNSIEMENTILVSHTVGLNVSSGSTATLQATLWGSGAWANNQDYINAGTINTGTVNIWGDPAFWDHQNHVYYIQSHSDAVDTGIDAGVTTDINDDTRPCGSGFDIGADEYDPASIPISGLQVNNDSPTERGMTTNFTATVSSGTNVEYNWDFGDGHSGNGQTTSNLYGAVGKYTATVTATNPINQSVVHTSVIITDTTPPNLPILFKPEHYANINDNTPTFEWLPSSSSDAAGYIFWLGGTETDLGNTSQYTPDPLSDGPYYWAVAAYDGFDNTSNFTPQWLVTIDTTPPSSAPTRLYPQDGALITDTIVNFQWTKPPDAYGNLIDINGTVTDVGNNTNYSPHLLNGVYTWTMASYDYLGNTTAFLTPWTFTMRGGVEGLATTNDSPTLLGETTNLTATVVWGTNVIYSWDFGDTNSGNGSSVNHTYSTAGVFEAEVTAFNSVNSSKARTYVTIYEHIIIPSGGGTFYTSDGVITLEAPTEITETITLTYTPQISSTHSAGDFDFAGIYFHLEAEDQAGNPIIELTYPLTITLSYDEASLPAGMDEADLILSRFDTDLNAWVELIGQIDTDANTIIVVLDHLSEFALLGPKVGFILYLPLILR